jgi:tetratricopeptide (TPR) repeat protein
LPFRRNHFFKGRRATLDGLRAALIKGGSLGAIQVVAGLGGIGKTQTVVEYAYQYRDDYAAVFWVRADTEVDLAEGFNEIAKDVDLIERNSLDENEIRYAVTSWLSGNSDYLLIFDNADNPALVRPYIPVDPKGHLILTSRAVDFDFLEGAESVIYLSTLAPEDALEFLFTRIGLRMDDASEHAAASALAEALGYLPLALEQAAAYMKCHHESFSDYFNEYKKLRIRLLEEQGPVTGDYRDTVRTTWTRSFEAVLAKSPASIDLINICAFLNCYRIPFELVLRGTTEFGERLATAIPLRDSERSQHDLNKLLAPLASHSLIDICFDYHVFGIHPLVQEVVRDNMSESDRSEFPLRALRGASRAFPQSSPENWSACERFLPHVLALEEWIPTGSEVPSESLQAFNEAAYYLVDHAQYEGAIRLFRRAIEISENSVGPEHIDMAVLITNLAITYRLLARYDDAESLFKRAGSIIEKLRGSESPEMATVLNNLGSLYQAKGQFSEAKSALDNALAIRERQLDQAAVAKSLNNLGKLYLDQGSWSLAEPVFRRALDINQTSGGLDSRETAKTTNNLGFCCHKLGNNTEAKKLLLQANKLCRKVLGRDHPERATCLNNLALVYQAERKYRIAESLCRGALRIRRGRLGSDHPETAASMNNLALLLHKSGRDRDKESESLLRDALAIRIRLHGAHHPETARSLNNLAGVVREHGRHQEADELQAQANRGQQQVAS